VCTACSRINATATEATVKLSNKLHWSLLVAHEIVANLSSLLTSSAHQTALSLSGCCSNSIWCQESPFGILSCTTHAIGGAALYENVGWGASPPGHAPVFSCYSAANGSHATSASGGPSLRGQEAIQAPPSAPEIRHVTPTYATVGDRLRVSGGGFGPDAAQLQLTLGGLACEGITACDQLCTECRESSECSAEQTCVRFSGAEGSPGACVTPCTLTGASTPLLPGAELSCPCGQMCQNFALNVDGTLTALCVNPDFEPFSSVPPCGSADAVPQPAAGASELRECTLTAARHDSAVRLGDLAAACGGSGSSGNCTAQVHATVRGMVSAAAPNSSISLPPSARGAACSQDDQCAAFDPCLLANCVQGADGGRCVISRNPAGACASARPGFGGGTGDLPPALQYVAMPLQASQGTQCPAGAGSPQPCFGGQSSLGGMPLTATADALLAVSSVDDRPLDRVPLNMAIGSQSGAPAAPAGAPVFQLPMPQGPVPSLWVSANGFVAADGDAGCPSSFQNTLTAPPCDFRTAFKGMLTPLAADLDPSAKLAARVLARVTHAAACVQWTDVPLFGAGAAGTFTTSLCASADGGVRFHWASLGIAGSVAALDATPSYWMAGARAQRVPFLDAVTPYSQWSDGGADLVLQRGGGAAVQQGGGRVWSNGSLPGASLSTVHQTVFSSAAIVQDAPAVGMCTAGSFACVSPMCGPAAAPPPVTIAWAGLACGLQVAAGPSWSHTAGGSGVWYDAGVRYACRFGGVLVEATDVTLPSDAAGDAAGALPTMRCVPPPLTEVLAAGGAFVPGVLNNSAQVGNGSHGPPGGQVHVPLELVALLPSKAAQDGPLQLVTEVGTLHFSSRVADVLTAGGMPVSALGSGGGPASVQAGFYIPPSDLKGGPLRSGGRIRNGLTMKQLTFTYRYSNNGSGSAGSGQLQCGCSGPSGGATDRCSSAGFCLDTAAAAAIVGPSSGGVGVSDTQVTAALSDCAGVVLGTAHLDGCGVCAGGSTDVKADSALDCLGVCFGNATCAPTPGPSVRPTSVPGSSLVDPSGGLGIIGLSLVLALALSAFVLCGLVAFSAYRRANAPIEFTPDGPADAVPPPGLPPAAIAALPVTAYARLRSASDLDASPPGPDSSRGGGVGGYPLGGGSVGSSRPPAAGAGTQAEVELPLVGQSRSARAASETADMDTCPVCLMEFEDGEDIVRLSCKHKYHPPCIKQWLGRSTQCPSCRHDLVPWAVSAGLMDTPATGRRHTPAASQQAPPSADALQETGRAARPLANTASVQVRPSAE